MFFFRIRKREYAKSYRHLRLSYSVFSFSCQSKAAELAESLLTCKQRQNPPGTEIAKRVSFYESVLIEGLGEGFTNLLQNLVSGACQKKMRWSEVPATNVHRLKGHLARWAHVNPEMALWVFSSDEQFKKHLLMYRDGYEMAFWSISRIEATTNSVKTEVMEHFLEWLTAMQSYHLMSMLIVRQLRVARLTKNGRLSSCEFMFFDPTSETTARRSRQRTGEEIKKLLEFATGQSLPAT